MLFLVRKNMLCFGMGDFRSLEISIRRTFSIRQIGSLASFIGRIWYHLCNPESEGQVIADHLAENPNEGYQPMTNLFPDEFILNIESERRGTLMADVFDGAVNIYGNGITSVLTSLTAKHYPITIKLRFPCTNDTVEQEACIASLKASLDMNVKDLEVYGDSILIINQSTWE